jgi:stage IV sporulation protein FA
VTIVKNEWEFNHKKRREEQVRVRQGTFRGPDSPSAPVWNPEWERLRERNREISSWNASIQRKSPRRIKWRQRFFYRMILATLLLLITSFCFQIKSPTTQPIHQFVAEVVTREFNFTGLSQWYQQYVGKAPVILPAFFPSHSKNKDAKKAVWITPTKGVMVLPFDNRQKGVILRTEPQIEVVAAMEGWVTFVGQKEGLGNTVIIRHANGWETWYGRLQTLRIKAKDWVKGGQKIGQVMSVKGESLVYLAVKQGNDFIDPASVMVFE